MADFTAIPFIDLSGMASADPADRMFVGRQIAKACTEVGFFYLTGHGVPQAVIDRAMAEALGFFRLPAEEKRKIAVNNWHRGFNAIGGALMYGATKPDYKEFFQIGLELGLDDPDVCAGQALRGPNQWPAEPAGFRPALEQYYAEVGRCGAKLLRGVALSLDLPEDFFVQHYTKPLQRTQTIYYPTQPAELGEDQFGVAPHSDFGCITLLYQDQTGGLEVCNRDGVWVQAPPHPGSFVINVGDLLERWSNKRFRSTPHRVVNRSGHERLSIATFYDPTYTALVDPRDLLGPDDEPAFEPIAAGDYILGRINAAFGYRKKSAS
jgi:isopenicillin N synthase-like dioxygenase